MSLGFIDLLKTLERGALLADLEESVREVVREVRATGKKGQVILRMEIERPAKTDDVVVLFRANPSKKVPRPDRKTTFLYADEKDDLFTNDPRYHKQTTDPPGGPARVLEMKKGDPS